MAHLRWQRGGDADVLALEGDRVTVRSSVSSAPGSRLDGSLASGRAVRVKVHRCRRIEEPPAFVIEGRLLDASRDLRAELATLVPIDPP